MAYVTQPAIPGLDAVGRHAAPEGAEGCDIVPIRSRCPACGERFGFNPRSKNHSLVPPHWPDGAYCAGSLECLVAR